MAVLAELVSCERLRRALRRPGRIDRDKTGYHLRAGYQASGGLMTGPEHYAEAERLLALADRHTGGVTYDQEWTLTLQGCCTFPLY
jgi:hypothetical protein